MPYLVVFLSAANSALSSDTCFHSRESEWHHQVSSHPIWPVLSTALLKEHLGLTVRVTPGRHWMQSHSAVTSFARWTVNTGNVYQGTVWTRLWRTCINTQLEANNYTNVFIAHAKTTLRNWQCIEPIAAVWSTCCESHQFSCLCEGRPQYCLNIWNNDRVPKVRRIGCHTEGWWATMPGESLC